MTHWARRGPESMAIWLMVFQSQHLVSSPRITRRRCYTEKTLFRRLSRELLIILEKYLVFLIQFRWRNWIRSGKLSRRDRIVLAVISKHTRVHGSMTIKTTHYLSNWLFEEDFLSFRASGGEQAAKLEPFKPPTETHTSAAKMKRSRI